MAALQSPEGSDRPAYLKYAGNVHKQRALLDEKDTIEKELKWLNQTLAFLSIQATSSSTILLTAANMIVEKKKKIVDIVNYYYYMYNMYLH